MSEAGSTRAAIAQLASLLPGIEIKKGAAAALERGFIARSGETVELTQTGRGAAADIIRRHRLWESYLVNEAVTPSDRVHDQAEQLEHIVIKPPKKDETDPHGRPIPPEPSAEKPPSTSRTGGSAT